MKDKISIITTFYNCENYLIRAFESIKNQVIPDKIDVEYIVLDDCSTDNSFVKASLYFQKFFTNDKIEVKLYQSETNLGTGAAKQLAIEYSSGNYIMFLDADDYYINSDFVQRAYDDITTDCADIVAYGFYVNDPFSGKKIENVADSKMIFSNNKKALINLFKSSYMGFMLWNKIYHRNVIESSEITKHNKYEDILTTPIWIENSNLIVVQPSIEINWRANVESITRKNNTRHRIETSGLLLNLAEHFKDNQSILNAIYERAMIDIDILMNDKTSYSEGFLEMNDINAKFLKYLYPDNYSELCIELV